MLTHHANELPLEDSISDIVEKAAAGRGIDSALPLESEEDLLRAETLLGLKTSSLAALRNWHPGPLEIPEGLTICTTTFHGLQVNSYLVRDAANEAMAFDTGSDCDPLLEVGARIRRIFVTHVHGDHIFDLDRFLEKTRATAHVSAREGLAGAVPFDDGEEFQIGSLSVKALKTDGHACGGTTFFVTGLEKPLAFTGDALFAGSMGGAPRKWSDALRSLRDVILKLPAETILCPGHGPLTTVEIEQTHNPFAA